MRKLSQEDIKSAYRDLVEKSGGKLVGEGPFVRETGISRHHWNGGIWRKWSAFQAECGYKPNIQTQKIGEETLLRRFAELSLEKQVIPTQADLELKRREDSSFPEEKTFRRWGGRDALLDKVAKYCADKPEFAPVVELLTHGESSNLNRRLESLRVQGFVYLVRSGKHYKIGRTNEVGRRLYELAIQLPKKPDTVHVIETDDPEGIEQYWHRRFADKRQGGEWFALSPEDVRAFKKRRFQ